MLSSPFRFCVTSLRASPSPPGCQAPLWSLQAGALVGFTKLSVALRVALSGTQVQFGKESMLSGVEKRTGNSAVMEKPFLTQ